MMSLQTENALPAAIFGILFVAASATAVAENATSGSSTRTVYDGGMALRQNMTSGAPVGADGSTYTDGNGGK